MLKGKGSSESLPKLIKEARPVKGKNPVGRKIVCLCLAAFVTASNLTVMAAVPDDTSSQSQTTSLPEIVYVNSYSGTERSRLFDSHWRFHQGEASGAEALTFDDSSWSDVQLPHDYSIEQAYSQNGEAESAYLPGGIGWYRKSFSISPEWKDKVISVDFGGVYMNSTIYINGHKLGTHPYGYTPFSFVLPSEYLNFDKENVIAVRVDHQTPSSRWYSGSGIYRSVHLNVTDPVHIARYGTSVVTPKENVGDVEITSQVQNDSNQAVDVVLKHTITEKGKTDSLTSVSSQTLAVPAGETKEIKDSLNVKDFKKWDIGQGNLYTITTQVIQNETVLDTYTTDFGFRWYKFDKDNGFMLNGTYHKLQGVCMHHDQGPLGAEAWTRAIERQVEILQNMGVNAIRVTHNPAADELIDICNQKGMLVIDEAFDTWTSVKNYNTQDYSRWFDTKIEADNKIVGGKPNDMTWAKFDLTTMVMRDKNAPSVILYSLGNELLEITTDKTGNYSQIATELSSWVKEADPTRPVTFGDNKLKGNDQRAIQMAEAIDKAGGIVGFNYASIEQMEQYKNRNWKMYGSETASAINSRGVYDRKSNKQDKEGDRLLTSYDKSKVDWGALASEAWWNTITVGYNAGTFVWTGFDYLGEPTPWNSPGVGIVGGTWPAPKHSYFGIVDLAGFPKDSYYFYQSQWNNKKHTLHILPTWNEEEIVLDKGKAEVVVYSDAPLIKLFLNNTLVGTAKAEQKKVGEYTYQQYTTGTGAFVPQKDHKSLYATFNVDYSKGTLRAEAWTAENGTQIKDTDGRCEVKTVDKPTALAATADRLEILADGRDLSYITIDVQDAKGNFVNNADPQIDVAITGQGRILAVENAMHNDHTPYSSTSRKAMKGKLLVIVQSTDTAGEFTVTATAQNLKPTAVKVTTKATQENVDENRVVSYKMARNIYVLKGNTPQLPKEVTLTYADGKTEVQPVQWESIDSSKYAENGTFIVNGKIQKANISTQVNITVMEGVTALQNYSTAIMVGSKPNLPSTRPAIQADGTVLNAEFPVTWNMDNIAFNQEKVYEVFGTANVFGKETKVTAWVRAGIGSIIEGDNLAPAAPGLYLNKAAKQENSPELRPLIDGKKDGDSWTGTGEIMFRYDTAQNLYKAVITRKANTPQVKPKMYWSGNGEDWTEVSSELSSEGNTDTYTLGQLAPAVWVKLEFPQQVSLTEIELIMGTPTFTINKSADLSKIVLDGVEVDNASMKAHDYPTQVLAVYETQITNDANASYTILPVHENIIRILTESEDKSSKAVYTIRLGQSTTGTIDPEDNSRDYAGVIKATAPSNAQSAPNEGGAELAIDKKENTIWHTNWGGGTGSEQLENKPQERYIELQLDKEITMDGLRYLPRKDSSNGRVTQYEVKVSTNGTDWQTAATGNWDDNGQWKLARFTAPFKAKQVRLYGMTTAGNVANRFMSAAEVAVQQSAEVKPLVDLSNAQLTLGKAFDYTGYPVEPRPVVVLDGKTLRYGIDYRMEYQNNVEPGTATLHVIGIIAYTGQIEKTFTINPADVKVEKYEPVETTTQVGEDPSGKLPSVVKAHMNIGPVKEFPVVWNQIQPEQYAKVGLFTIEGTVEGQTIKPQATIQVIGALAAENVSMAVLEHTQPELPKTISIYFSDETSVEYPVQWNTENIEFTAGKIVQIPGTVTVGTATLQTTASVRVVDSTQAEQQLVSQKVEGSTLPLAISFYSPELDSAANINDGSMLFQNTDGKKIWSDWEGGKFHNSPWVGIVLGQVDQPIPQTVNKISIGFIAETGETALKVPQDFKVQYYVGDTLDYDATNVNNGQKWTHLSNENNWKDVENLNKGDLPSDDDYKRMIDATFDSVKTTAIRVVMKPKEKQWVGVEELQVYGIQPQSYKDFMVSSIKLDGTDRLSDFDEQKTLTVKLTENKFPEIEASATNNAAVSVVPSINPNGKAYIYVLPENGDADKLEVYTIQFESDTPISHTITANVPHLKCSHTQATQGETITLSLEQGYALKENTLKVVSNGNELAVDPSALSFEMPAAEVTITAETQPIVYDIRYDLAGGQLVEQNPSSYTIETPTFTLHNPTREGYTFEGWINGEGQTPMKEVAIETGSTGTRSFIALWKALPMPVPTQTPVPTEKPESTTTPAATPVPLPPATPTKPNNQSPATADNLQFITGLMMISSILFVATSIIKHRCKD